MYIIIPHDSEWWRLYYIDNIMDDPFDIQGVSSPMAQWVGTKPQESKSHGFEFYSCNLVRAYGSQNVQVRPVRLKINHLKTNYV